MTPDVDTEGTLVRYLLGRLPEEESEALEKRYFADDDLFERLVAAEADLADAFARGTMSDEDRRAFEERLLASPRLRERVEFARTFDRHLLGRSASPRASGAASGPSTRWLPLAAAAVLVLGGALLVREAVRLRSERESLLAARSALEEQVRRLERESGDQQQRLADLSRRLADLQAAAAAAPAVRVVPFALAAGLLRDASPSRSLIVPNDVDAVDLEAPLEVSAQPPYSATLSRPTGEKVFSVEGLTARGGKGGPSVVVRIPASLIAPGDYVVTVRGFTRAGKLEDVGDYALRVGRK